MIRSSNINYYFLLFKLVRVIKTSSAYSDHLFLIDYRVNYKVNDKKQENSYNFRN